MSLVSIKKCLDDWTKQKEKGEQYLARIELGQSSKELDSVLIELKRILDDMMNEYVILVENLGLEQDAQENIPKEVELLRQCIDMYDQEYMVKECIRGTVSEEGFATKQHLAGSVALWKSEAYIDQEIINEIKQY